MKLTCQLIAAQIALGAASAARSLQPWSFTPLPLGSVRPEGWLLGEMNAVANGLAGHEHDFYVFVNESSWLNEPGTGGTEYSNLNEALPYWFNSLVPLAYQLDDARLKKQVQDVADTVLSQQADDGWIGPEVGDARNVWARTPFLLGLTQLVEADKSWEDKSLKSMRRFMKLMSSMVQDDGTGFVKCGADVDCRWGQARIHDFMITIQWLLENHPSDQDAMLYKMMDTLYEQNPYKWDEWYTEGTYPKVVENPDDESIFPYIHGVNVGQGLKASSVMYRANGEEKFVQKSHDAVDWTFRYHGSASGTVLADEKLTGDASYAGSELCTAVETSYSLAYMFQVLGDKSFADRAERTIFNAMPVMMTGDKWAHQYMAQPNQPNAVNITSPSGGVPPVFTNANGGMATTFGMEPQYPCCVVNHPQGYPKFLANSWVGVGKKGLAHALIAPSSVKTTVNGGAVSIKCETSYPFTSSLTYTITAEHDFDFYVRVPQYFDKKESTLKTSTHGLPPFSSPDSKTGMSKIKVRAGHTQVSVSVSGGIRTEARPDNSVAFFYGNLLYALEVGFKESSSLPHSYGNPRGPGISGLPFDELRDYYIKSTKPWNVAVDPSTVRYHGADGQTLKDPIFEQGQPPNYMTVQGCEIAWDLYMGVTPDRPPQSRKCTGPKKSFRLIPYGAAKVHMSDLPTTKF